MRVPDAIAKRALLAGVEEGVVHQHSSTPITAPSLAATDLALAMSREHRRHVVEMDPSLSARVFTIRELARLMGGVSSDDLNQVADRSNGSQPRDRLLSLLHLASARRATVLPPTAPEEDDVIDPFGRSSDTYDRSCAQLLTAIPTVERVIRAAASERPFTLHG